jgi:hypothetical protein
VTSFLEAWWVGESSLLDDWLLGNLMGLSNIFFVDWKRRKGWIKKRGDFRGHWA